jgi:hypothetical protein
VTNAGAVTITGKLNISGDSSASSGYLDNTGGTQFTVGGDAYIAGSITNTTGKIYFEGNLKEGYGTFNNALGGVILIDGDFITTAAMTNAGIMDINGDLINTAYNAQVNNTTGSLSIGGNCTAAQGISCGTGGNIAITGNLQTLYILNGNAPIAVYGNCQISSYISNSGDGSIIISGNCQVGTHVINSGGGTITIYGKLDINGDSSGTEGYFNNTGGGDVVIGGDMFTTGTITNTTGSIFILGNCKQSYGNFTNGAGVVIVDGDVDSQFVVNGAGHFDILGDCHAPLGFSNDGTVQLAGNLTINDGALLVTGGAQTNIYGDCIAGQGIANSGNISISGNCKTRSGSEMVNTTGNIDVFGDCFVSQNITNFGGVISIVGILRCYGTITNTGTLSCSEVNAGITGIVLGTGSIFTSASCTCKGAFTANADSVLITINGDAQIAGAFSLGGGTSGTCMVAGNFTVDADVAIQTGAVCNISGIASIQGTVTNSGTLTYKMPNGLDGIYLNAAIAAGGSGTPDNPCRTFSDLKMIMAATGLNKVYLIGAQRIIGSQTAANNATVMTDAAVSFIPNSLIGLTIFNVSDQSSGVITVNTANTVTVAALTGGNDNTFETGDAYWIPYSLTITSNISCQIVGSPGYDIYFSGGVVELFGDLVCGSIYGSAFVDIQGNVFCAGLLNYSGGDFTVNGKLVTGQANPFYPLATYNYGISLNGTAFFALGVECAGSFTDTSSNVNIFGDCKVYEDIWALGNDQWEIQGDCICSTGALTVNASNVSIYGNLVTNEFVNLLGTAPVLLVKGNVKTALGCLIETGTLTCANFTTQTYLQVDDTATVAINGDCSLGTFALLGGGASGVMTVSGNLSAGGNVTVEVGASLTAGPITCDGDITNAGTITSNGGILYAGTYTNTGTVNNNMYKTP